MYGTAWKHFRASTITRFGLVFCGDRPLGAPVTDDSECRRRGLRTRGRTLDHIRRVTGPNDPSLLQVTAVQWLCRHCDQVKRQRESQEPMQYDEARTSDESTTWG